MLGCTIRIALIPISISVGTASAAPLPGQPATYFPIGVFYQPAFPSATTSFQGWVGRGVNTLVGHETQGTVNIADYDTQAVAAGLKLIREATNTPATDTSPNVIAWMLHNADEPEDNPNITPAQLNAEYTALKAANPTRPILMNFAGAHMINGFAGHTWATPLTQADYAPFLASADWVAQDVYPVTGWIKTDSPSLAAPGFATSVLRNWSGNKPAFTYIETSNQRLLTNDYPQFRERGVTPAEFRAEVWDSIIQGTRGIIYFPQMLNGFQYDGTPINVAVEMTKQNAIITGMATALNSDDIPDVSTVVFTANNIKYLVKSVNGVTYVIALNLSNLPVSTGISANFSYAAGGLREIKSNTLLLPNAGGSFTDTFEAYGVKIYAEGPANFVALSIPEPTTLTLLMLSPMLLMRRRRRDHKLLNK